VPRFREKLNRLSSTRREAIDTINLTHLLGDHASHLLAEWNKLSLRHRARKEENNRYCFDLHGSKIHVALHLIGPDDNWGLPASFSICLLENPLWNTDGLVLNYPLDEVPRDANEIYKRYREENKGRLLSLLTLLKYQSLLVATYRDFIRLVDASAASH
jgi:hypothetical protein